LLRTLALEGDRGLGDDRAEAPGRLRSQFSVTPPRQRQEELRFASLQTAL